MKFISVALIFSLAATGFACRPEQDCCWKDVYACYRQHSIFNRSKCDSNKYAAQMCERNNVSAAQCSADCCSISKKIGIACP
ncbi:Cytochrome P450 [Macrophomina phaseolina MS6]|uniref:Cytochrome P450 n=1 Tax=Macrophomina phaseolina (strain MS6) TaxID=1126212 RepID=K2SEA8_MACPH|nr:Cytochrome P450 [Macrophomina phaseolina MS6]